MKHITKDFLLDCSPEEAWQLVIDRNKYEKWTKVFSKDSTYIGVMGLNEIIKFVDADGNGLVSKIDIFEVAKEIQFAFLGEITDGKYTEIPEFADMLEHYVFEPVGKQTKMIVDVAMDNQYYDMMNEMWDKAGIELKNLSKQ